MGRSAPEAAGIIHLGATSCYVTDNADMILIRDAFAVVRAKLVTVIRNLAAFAEENKSLPCLAYTHLQSAQPTTVGKRAALWLQDFTIDYGDLKYVVDNLRLLGNKGATARRLRFCVCSATQRRSRAGAPHRRTARLRFGVPVSGADLYPQKE